MRSKNSTTCRRSTPTSTSPRRKWRRRSDVVRPAAGAPGVAGVAMRVLGLDPGTTSTGYGVVERDDDRLVRVAAGVIRVGSGDLATRLVHLHRELERLIATWMPTACAIEDLFYHRSARSALALGHARGVCL